MHRRATLVLGLFAVAHACGGGKIADTTADSSSTGSSSTGGPASATTDESSSSTTTLGTTAVDTSTSSGDESSTSTGGTSTTGGEVDCDSLPTGPLSYSIVVTIRATEDFAWDDQGNTIGLSDGGLFRTPYAEPGVLWVPGIDSFIAGIRTTSNGMVVFNDATTGTLFRINAQDAPEPVLSGINYPNGLEVDLDGFVYVAENGTGAVRRVDPVTGEFTVLSDQVPGANGVSFSPDYSILYVGSFGGGTITAIHMAEDGTAESVVPFYTNIGGGSLDGMAVDACGNVYVCEFGPAIVWRIPPDGSALEQLANFGQDTGWIPNMQFGSGIGGWDAHTLYVLDIGGGHVFEVDVGVTDKPRGYPLPPR